MLQFAVVTLSIWPAAEVIGHITCMVSVWKWPSYWGGAMRQKQAKISRKIVQKQQKICWNWHRPRASASRQRSAIQNLISQPSVPRVLPARFLPKIRPKDHPKVRANGHPKDRKSVKKRRAGRLFCSQLQGVARAGRWGVHVGPFPQCHRPSS